MNEKKLSVQEVMAVDGVTLSGKTLVQIRKSMSNLIPRGVHISGGYRPGTGQLAVSVKFDQNYPLEEQLGIVEFLPFITPCVRDSLRGSYNYEARWVDVFDSGGLGIGVMDDKTVLASRFDRKEWKEEGHFIKCLEEVYKYHPYMTKDNPYDSPESTVDRMLYLLDQWKQDGNPGALELEKALYPNKRI